MMHGRTSKALGTVETSTHSYQTKAPLNEALGTVETSNHSYQTKAPLNEALGTVEASHHSYQTKAPLKATRTKMNGTFMLKCLLWSSLSAVNGWVLPLDDTAHDSSLSSHESATTGGVDSTRDRRQLLVTNCHGSWSVCPPRPSIPSCLIVPLPFLLAATMKRVLSVTQAATMAAMNATTPFLAAAVIGAVMTTVTINIIFVLNSAATQTATPAVPPAPGVSTIFGAICKPSAILTARSRLTPAGCARSANTR